MKNDKFYLAVQIAALTINSINYVVDRIKQTKQKVVTNFFETITPNYDPCFDYSDFSVNDIMQRESCLEEVVNNDSCPKMYVDFSEANEQARRYGPN